jgi:hypothetical protein
MDIEFANLFAEQWIDAWNSHDIEKIISHYSAELEFKSPLIIERYSDPSGTIYNREKLKEYFLIGITNNPSLKFKFKQLLVGINSLTLYYKNARGGETAEYFEFNSNKKIVKCMSCYSV